MSDRNEKQQATQMRIVELETLAQALQRRVAALEEHCDRISTLLEAAPPAHNVGRLRPTPPAAGVDDRPTKATLSARAGDRLIIKGHRVGEPDRDAEILEVRGLDGGPPFVVRWSDDGHVSFLIPGSDAVVQHLEHRANEASLR